MGPEQGGWSVHRVVVLGIAILAGALAPAAAGAKGKPPLRPDLKVTVLEAHLGNPAYAVVATNGVLEPIEVKLEIRNQGKAAAPASTAVVFVQDSSRHQFLKRVAVPRLKAPKRSHVRFVTTVEITGAKPALGFAKMGAVADFGDKVADSDRSNNLFKGERFAIVAKEWDAKTFDTITKAFVASDTTLIRAGFRFVLSRYDRASEKWVYKPYGSVTDQASETGVCSGSSNETRTHNPWADSYLKISGDLGGYDALVQPQATETYSITFTCLSIGSHTEQRKFQPLETFVGVKRQPVMRPNQQQLADSTTDTALRTTWQWDFRAALG